MRFFLLILLVSCGGLQPSDKYEEPNKEPVNPPISNVSYRNDIAPIMAKSCLGANCHNSPGASNISLDSFENVKANFNRSIASINSGRMPKGRSMSEADKAVLKKWSPLFAP